MDEFAIRVVSRDLKEIGVREIKVIKHYKDKDIWMGEISFNEGVNKYWANLDFRPRKNETYKSFKKRVVEVVNTQREKVQVLLLSEDPKELYKYRNGSSIEKFKNLIYYQAFSVARERGINISPDDVQKKSLKSDLSDMIERGEKPLNIFNKVIESVLANK